MTTANRTNELANLSRPESAAEAEILIDALAFFVAAPQRFRLVVPTSWEPFIPEGPRGGLVVAAEEGCVTPRLEPRS